jgi:hypothetical protein
MLEYIILFIFIGLIFYPLQMDMTSKTLELILVCYAAYKSLLIGLFCAIIFVYHLSLKDPASASVKKMSLYELEERIRPKESNSTCVTKKSESAYSPHESTEPYKAFNVEI